MDLRLIPLKLILTGKITLKLKLPLIGTLSITIWKKTIWTYTTPAIVKRIFHLTTKEKDPDPPLFQPVIDDGKQVHLIAYPYLSFTLMIIEERTFMLHSYLYF